MILLKLITSPSYLHQDTINKWLEENKNIEIISIGFSQNKDNLGQIIYSSMIYYKKII